MASKQLTETIQSGDVTLFLRRFGEPGQTPLLILHGGNYFDSADLVDIAEQLGHDREVAAFDARGFGQSSWSTSKDYSHRAMLADVGAVLDHLGWSRAVMIGHSRGGVYALLTAARTPERVAGLVLVDYNPLGGFGPPPQANPAGPPPVVFPTIEALLATMTRQQNIPKGSKARSRVLEFLKPVEGGFRLAARDPAFTNQIPEGGVVTQPPVIPRGGAEELDDTSCKVLIIRAKRSKMFTPEHLAALGERSRTDVVEIESGHDIPGEVPEQLVGVIGEWLPKI